MPEDAQRVVVWFSCGAASAVAAHMAVARFGDTHDVHVVYCDTSADEHPDNARFLADVERWIERKVERIKSDKYTTLEQVFRGVRYIVGPHGAACTRELKRKPAQRCRRPGDINVYGLTADEQDRINNLEENEPGLRFAWVLRDSGITKGDCYKIVDANGIRLPEMYRLGFSHSNCVGCVKGGKGHWNRIRVLFPERFAAMAALQRELGVAFKNGSGLWWLDELRPGEGRNDPAVDLDCGLLCADYRGYSG